VISRPYYRYRIYGSHVYCAHMDNDKLLEKLWNRAAEGEPITVSPRHLLTTHTTTKELSNV